MPIYSYYPQGRVPAGTAVEARFEDDAAAMAHAKEVGDAHPDADDVSVWSEDRYVGRLAIPVPVAQPTPASQLAAKAKRPRRAATRTKRGAGGTS